MESLREGYGNSIAGTADNSHDRGLQPEHFHSKGCFFRPADERLLQRLFMNRTKSIPSG